MIEPTEYGEGSRFGGTQAVDDRMALNALYVEWAESEEDDSLVETILRSPWLRHHDAGVIRAYADLLDSMTRAHDYVMDDADWDEHRRLTASLRAYADELAPDATA